ncbi:MAG TPA: pyrroloquinoline quinone biosynthesis peptide chaperone PqqD [Gemmatimonadales bacterium]|nr:pyrroloquinoline quinone biosynthesis peptide chaperone PqqD [Gemmatimonadales bacterium]
MTPRVAAKARLQWDGVRNRHILLYPEGLVALNPTAAEILGLCDGRRTVEEIVAELRSKYESQDITADVQELLAGLAAKGLVTYDA